MKRSAHLCFFSLLFSFPSHLLARKNVKLLGICASLLPSLQVHQYAVPVTSMKDPRCLCAVKVTSTLSSAAASWCSHPAHRPLSQPQDPPVPSRTSATYLCFPNSPWKPHTHLPGGFFSSKSCSKERVWANGKWQADPLVQ